MIDDFLSHPMRANFLLASLVTMLGGTLFFTNLDFITLHKIFFLCFLPMLAYSGFLLTALPDWTNYKGALKSHNILLLALFLLAFLGIFISLKITMIFVSLFWLYLLCFSAYLLVLARNNDNFSILFVLFSFFALSLLYALTSNENYLNLQIHINIIAVLVVSFRIGIVLGREALRQDGDEDSLFMANFTHKNLASWFLFIYIFSEIFLKSQIISGYIAAGVGFVILANLKEWHYAVLLKRHFVLFYYTILLLTGVGYVGFGLSQVLSTGLESQILHIIAIVGILGIIYLVFTTAGLRHSGFVLLSYPRVIKFGFILLVVAAILRGVFGYFSPLFYTQIPALLVIVAYTFYMVKFFFIFKDNEFSDDPE
ncbi:MAG: hypothetical protein GX282_03225 [Campylobacteraceae bacterium]|nr:hypothetical protein [Campylobacteraceae bacterium]